MEENMTDIKQKQERLLNMLKQFDSFARENSIRYYVASGSCLGAVREKGFIPWDADIDILLPYDMYKKCEATLLSRGYDNIMWLSYKNNKDAPNLMGRIYEKEATVDNLEQYPYLDLFALVGAPEKTKAQERLMKKSLLNYRIFWIKKRKYKNSLSRKKSRIGFALQILLFLFPAFLCIKEFEKELELYPYDGTDYVAPLTGIYGLRDIMERKWFEEDPIFVSFCDMEVPVTKYTHEYLSHLYGDSYMIPVQFDRYK